MVWSWNTLLLQRHTTLDHFPTKHLHTCDRCHYPIPVPSLFQATTTTTVTFVLNQLAPIFCPFTQCSNITQLVTNTTCSKFLLVTAMDRLYQNTKDHTYTVCQKDNIFWTRCSFTGAGGESTKVTNSLQAKQLVSSAHTKERHNTYLHVIHTERRHN